MRLCEKIIRTHFTLSYKGASTLRSDQTLSESLTHGQRCHDVEALISNAPCSKDI